MYKLKYLIIISSLLIGFNSLKSQDLKWVKDIGGNNLVTVRAMDLDKNGNIYTIGEFEGSTDFDPSSANFILTPILNGYKDIYIQKLDSNGNFLWAKSIGEVNTNYCSDILISNDGSFYIAGHFRDSLDFDPSNGVNMLYTQARDDGYIAKYDSKGNLVWAKGLHGSINTRVFKLELDNSNNILAAGNFDIHFSYGSINSADSIGSGNRNDVFVCKIDQNGNWVWGNAIGGVSYLSSSSVCVDSNNNIYLSGTYQGIADFDPSSSIFQKTANGNYDVYILKLDSNGSYAWVKTLESTASSFDADIKINNSGVYISGYFSDTLDLNPGTSNYPVYSTGNFDAFILRLDLQGNFVWGKSIYGINGSYGNSLSFNNANEVILSGEFFGTCDFDPDSSSVLNITSNGNLDLYFLKLTKNGSFISALSIGGSGYEYLTDSDQLSNSEFVFTGSYTSNVVDFDPNSGVTNVLANGQFNYYTLKLSDSTNTVGIFQNRDRETSKFLSFPNPASDFIQIVNPFAENVYMTILNANGLLVFEEIQLEAGRNQIPINLSNGSYFLKLRSNIRTEIIKLIIE